MLTQEERFLAGLSALEELTQHDGKPRGFSEKLEKFLERSPRQSPAFPSVPPAPAGIYLPSLQELISRYSPFSPGCVILGICEDGLPIVLDLNHPTSGALVVSGDPHSGKTRLLRSILASAGLMNSPLELQAWLYTSQPEEYRHLVYSTLAPQVIQRRPKAIRQWIDQLLDLANQRLLDQSAGPTILILVDDLADFIYQLDEESYWAFEWIARIGPQLRLWTIAALSTHSLEWVDDEALGCFPTRALLDIASPLHLQRLAGEAQPGLPALARGHQFCLPYQDHWMPVWICDPG